MGAEGFPHAPPGAVPMRSVDREPPRRIAKRGDPMPELLATPWDLGAALAALADRNT